MATAPRNQAITVGVDSPTATSVSIYRDETRKLTMSDPDLTYHLTISGSASAAPIVEIPSDNEGVISITPDKVSSLEEGRSYQMNIWDTTSEDYPTVVVTGSFVTTPTIAPTLVEYATQFLDDGSQIVVLTESEYIALDPKDADTIYVITEDPS